MKTAIIVSTKDPAGLNIKESLLELFDFKELDKEFESHKIYQLKDITIYTTDKKSIHCENIDKEISSDLFIFATKHQSKKGIASLSCHSPGNWNKAEFGGKKSQLCIAPASLLKNAYLELKKQNNLKDFDTTLECTHHGPYLEKPCFFIEIGSSEKEWKNKDAGKIIANTIINIKKENNHKTVFGIGGPHYCNNFNKLLERTELATGHICPKHMLPYLDKELILQAIEKTQNKPELIMLDWKGLGTEKANIVNLLKELNIKYERL